MKSLTECNEKESDQPQMEELVEQGEVTDQLQ
jgi:hypothetical protein